MEWIGARCGKVEPGAGLQPMYGIDGHRRLDEMELPHLAAYRDSAPVRIGNAAHQQLQLDIYGELLDAIYRHDKYASPISFDLWQALRPMIDWLSETWRRADSGICEVRGGSREFLFSRFMSWVAFDRAIRLARKRGLPAPLDRWQAERADIYESVFDELWNSDLEAFVQHKGAATLDASTLLMPMVRFISPTAPASARRSTPSAAASARTPSSTATAARTSSRPPPATAAPKAPSTPAPSGTPSASPAPAIPSRPATSSKRCSATPTTSASTPKSWATAPTTSAISRRRSRTSA